MNRLVIETPEDWRRLEEMIRAGVRERISALQLSGFQLVRKKSDVPGYSSWMAMRQRCRDKNKDSFRHYGGRGIKVCERWRDSFENFIADMGERPTPRHSIDRIDANGDYEPANCRWATWTEQARNQRQTVYATVDGERKTLKEWSEITGIKYGTIYTRIVLWGWSPAEAIKTKLHGRWKRRASHDRGRSLGQGSANSEGGKRASGGANPRGDREGEEQG